MQNLPIGIQTFSEIIEKDYLYIDKTESIYNLLKKGKYFFLSRPRRFGKSLLVSTLKEIFKGNKELFKGLYIYDKIDWIAYPVISFSFSSITYSQSEEIFREEITKQLIEIGLDYNISITEKTIILAFKQLLTKLSKTNKVVILIDEYDKPIIDYITDKDKSKLNRNVLREFYGLIKDYDEHIKFCLLTGVSKFSKVSVFSGLNNLYDITLDRNFSTICGITQDELNKYFDDRLPAIADEYGITIEELKLKIKEWYNGYSWDGVNKLYNPFSILNFFNSYKFDNFWFSSGTPTFLIEKFRESKTVIEDIKEFKTASTFFDQSEIDIIDFRPLLFQTGYLTVKEYDFINNIYTLGYPNKEVKDAFLSYIAATFVEKSPGDLGYLNTYLRLSLMNNDLNGFFKYLKSIFSSIPYQLHIANEAYYHSLFYLIMELTGIEMDLEVSTNKGRIDGVIEFEEVIYIIEFKYLSDNKNVEELLNTAINQIKTKEYFAPYLKKGKSIKYLAIALNKETVEYKFEEN